MIWKKHRLIGSDDEEENSRLTIEAKAEQALQQGNRIYFYSSVDNDTASTLIKQIDEATRQMLLVSVTLDVEPPPVKLYMRSDGGELDAAVAIADHIQTNKVPVCTYVEGTVCSAATLISVVGKKRFITKNSSMLIHQLTTEFWGKYGEFQDEMKNLDLGMSIIRKFYTEHTGLTSSALDDLLKHDLYMDAATCLAFGLVDEII